MRIISLLQPWATLWVAGAKLIETRSWGTDYRGRVAVHASKGFDHDQVAACYRTPFAQVLTELGFDTASQLSRGAILGWVDLVGCLDMCLHTSASHDRLDQVGAICIECDARLTDQERAFGNARGRVAWMTGRERFVLAEPVPWRGGQGLRNLDPEVAARLA